MNVVSLAARNALRNRGRTLLTVAGVAVMVLTFVLMRTVIWAYTMSAEVAAKDRVISRHKVSFVLTLPKRYVETVRQAPGVAEVTWASWFSGKDPKHDNEFFATLAVDPKTYFEVYDEMQVAPATLEAWKQDRRGAIVGDVLAQKLGWKPGDKVMLQSQMYPGDWEFTVTGIYKATRQSIDRSQLIFHWDYMNEGVPQRMRDQIGWTIARVRDAPRSAEVTRAIDRTFADKDVQTLSQSEGVYNQSFLGNYSALLQAIDLVSVVILLIMMLILGNTIAMGVRERTHEYGTLRAIGFLPRHVAAFVLGEAAVVGALGGLLGLALAYPLVEQGLGRFIEENMGAFFPYFRINPLTSAAAFGLALLLAAAAAALPAWNAARIRVVDALRRVV